MNNGVLRYLKIAQQSLTEAGRSPQAAAEKRREATALQLTEAGHCKTLLATPIILLILSNSKNRK